MILRLTTVITLSVASAACERAPGALGHLPAPTPQLFAPGVVSTDAREYGIAFTPSGTVAYFTRRLRQRRAGAQILVTRFVEGAWTEPELAPFSTDRDEAPFITADGERMLFSSRRFVTGSLDRSPNIWVMERTSDGWSDPSPLEGVVNQPRGEIDDFTTGSEMGPVLLADGSLLYWTAADPEWGNDVYVADPDPSGAFMNPRPLRLNSYGDESNPAMSPGGRYLVFQAYRDARGVGEQDLYVVERTAYGWSDPWLLPEPINSERSDGYPSFSPDGRYFFFASDRDARAGIYSIYYVDVQALGLEIETR